MSEEANLDHAIRDQALAWHLRLRDAGEEDWLAFTGWLEEDPAHSDAYDAVAMLDPYLDEAQFPPEAEAEAKFEPVPLPANDFDDGAEGPRSIARHWMALAATLLVGMLVVSQFLMNPAAPYTVQTAAGERQSITLADGGTIELNGASELILDRNDPRVAELVAGEAHFTVVHDAGDPFTVTVGDNRLVDIGTVFNVLHEGEQLRVEVAEGAVRYEGRETVDLAAGDTLRRDGDGNISLSRRPVEAIGGWVDGMLVYDAASLAEIAADMSRATGIAITTAPNLAEAQFSGVIQLDGGPEAVRARLENLLDLEITSEEAGWTISP